MILVYPEMQYRFYKIRPFVKFHLVPCLQVEKRDDSASESSGCRIPQSIQQANGGDNQKNDPWKCVHHSSACQNVWQDHRDDPWKWRNETEREKSKTAYWTLWGQWERTG